MCLPLRIVSMNICSVHWPRPVLLSGVRFAVKEMPHGPDQDVNVIELAAIHGASSFGPRVILMDSGWPESMRSMSGSGPFGPIFVGVWQSLQADVDTMYFPRSTG